MAGRVRRGIAVNRAYLIKTIKREREAPRSAFLLFLPSTDERSKGWKLVLRLSYKQVGLLVVRRKAE
jgi:hypothetical protein